MSNHSFKTELEELEVEINFDYQPEEEKVNYYPDGTGYPGCAESVSINSVIWISNGSNPKREVDIKVDVQELLTQLGFYDALEQACFDHVESYGPD
jgi:hypothetical protein